MKAHKGQLAVAAGVAAIGVAVFVGSLYLPSGGGYAKVGPDLVPRFVGLGIILIGAFLLYEAFSGGFRGVDEEAEEKLPMDWPSFAWVTAGIIGYGLLIEHAGFVVSSTLLFVLVARGFSSRRWLLNAATGVLLAAVVFAIFNYGLGLTLPSGIFGKLL